MKRGNACHSDYTFVMGNTQNIGVHDCIVRMGGYELVIPANWLTRDGRYKKMYQSCIRAMLRSMETRKAVAA